MDIWKDKKYWCFLKDLISEYFKSNNERIRAYRIKNIIAGFQACGIVPLNPENILKRIPRENAYSDNSWLNSFESHLAECRLDVTSTNTRRKRLTIPPGRSIS